MSLPLFLQIRKYCPVIIFCFLESDFLCFSAQTLVLSPAALVICYLPHTAQKMATYLTLTFNNIYHLRQLSP